MDFEEDESDSDYAEHSFSLASAARNQAYSPDRFGSPLGNDFEEDSEDSAPAAQHRAFDEFEEADSEDSAAFVSGGALEEDAYAEDPAVPAARFRPVSVLNSLEEDSDMSGGFALEEEEDSDASGGFALEEEEEASDDEVASWQRPSLSSSRPLGRSSQFAQSRGARTLRLEESGDSDQALEESADSDQALEESDEENTTPTPEMAEESEGEGADSLEDRAEDYLLASADAPAALEESDSEAAAEPRSLEESAEEGEEEPEASMDLEKAAAPPQVPASRDLEVEQYFHAGSDLELLRSKLEASTLAAKTKSAYSKQLVQMEDILAQLSASKLGASEREELVGELKARMGPVKAMTQEIDAATPKKPMDLEKADGEPLLMALDSVKHLKEQLGEHVSAKDRDNLNSLISDLQLFEGSTDAEESADLVRAIEMRLPAVQDLANHIRSVSQVVANKAPTPVLDLEKDSAPSKDEIKAADDKSDKEEAVKAPEPESNPMAAAVKTAAATQSALGLEKIHQLQDILRNSKLSEEKRGRFLTNLEGLEKDEKALAATDLTSEQRSDLESAMKLRLTMLADMQQFLDKL